MSIRFLKLNKIIWPALKEVKSLFRYYKIVLINDGALLKKVKKTESVFIHIPKTAGKSIFKSIYSIGLHESYGHVDVNAYLSILGKKKFDKYFKFAFVRNPWSRLYSAYNFACQGGFGSSDKDALTLKKQLENIDFPEFIKRFLSKELIEKYIIFKPQYTFVCDASYKILLNRVCYFENMEDEYIYLSKRFGIVDPMPHVNKSIKNNFYQDAYDEEMKKIVADFYSIDIELFGYNFYGMNDKIYD